VFAPSLQFHPSQIFVGKDRNPPLEDSLARGATLVGSSLSTNIKLEWKRLKMTNTLAY